jgi:hypothetical protein
MEQRMLWLVPHVGVRRVLTAEVALPTKLHFPELFQRSGWDVETLFDHACRLMGVERDELELRVSNKAELPDAAGTYCGRDMHGTITVREESFDDPEALLGAMFHELAQHLLLSRKLIDASEPDHEPTTDLVPVILGLGVFAAP